MFWEVYGDLVLMYHVSSAEFAELRRQESDWAGHSERLVTAIASGVLGRKLFAGLQQYIVGAQVLRECEVAFDKFLNAGAEVTDVAYEAEITRITTEVAESSSDLTDGIRRTIQLQLGNLDFVLQVSSFQEDLYCLVYIASYCYLCFLFFLKK